MSERKASDVLNGYGAHLTGYDLAHELDLETALHQLHADIMKIVERADPNNYENGVSPVNLRVSLSDYFGIGGEK